MNTQSDLERMLGQQLSRQASGMDAHDAPLGLADVKGRATRIRRTRRAVAGGVVAAALAVVVPTVMTLGGATTSTREIDPAPSPVSPTESTATDGSSPEPRVTARTELTLDGLERGDDPVIEYFTPDGVVLPDRGLVELGSSYQAMVESPADRGWIAVEPDGQGIRYLSRDFEPQGGSASTGSLATSADRSQVAWVAPEAGAQSLVIRSLGDPDAGTVIDLPASPVIQVVDFVDAGRVVVELMSQTGPPSHAIVEPNGSLTELAAYENAMAASSTTGLISVMTESNTDGSGCFGVVDAAGDLDEPLWETCDHSLGGFSPDGRHVMASDPYLDGLGLASLSILDARTGEVVAEFEPDGRRGPILVGSSWEGSDAVIASALGDGEQVLLRLGVDGTLEDASERVGSVEGDFFYYLGRDRARM